MDILLTDVQKWYASKMNKQVEDLDSFDLFCAKVAYDYHTEQCNIASVVGQSKKLRAFKQFLQSEYHLPVSNRMVDEFNQKLGKI